MANATTGPNASAFFVNRECEYYPCHGGLGEELNCLFCYCPLYGRDCGEPQRFVHAAGMRFKDCSGCEFPHRASNYPEVIRRIMGPGA